MAKNSETVIVTDDNFSDIAAKYPLMVVDCWAPWCGPCRMIAPIIEELAKEYSGKVAFGKLNVDENENLPRKFNIMGIPTLLFIKDGEFVDNIVGVVPKGNIVAKIDEVFHS